ncbi:hypothetical protein, partial [Paenibacillus sp. Marseille-Q4541]|uniref:hypothetical protein n=1 Tax=Paenibacillus sp. Marseille-Q4541 TaxID=2831522 RepID=UPI001BAC3CEA
YRVLNIVNRCIKETIFIHFHFIEVSNVSNGMKIKIGKQNKKNQANDGLVFCSFLHTVAI